MDCDKHKENFIKKATEKFGNKFDYSNVEYVSCTTPVKIVCPLHGEFIRTPSEHLFLKYGCPLCGKEHQIKPLLGKEAVIEKSREKYGDKYDFSKFEYKGINEKSCIICPKHGEFWATPQIHLRSKTGCPKCGKESSAKNNTLSTEKFIERARKIHGDKYDYSKVNCNGWYTYVTIICPKHGEFTQRVEAHLKGAGCQECGKEFSPKITQQDFLNRYEQKYNIKFPYKIIEYHSVPKPLLVHYRICRVIPKQFKHHWQIMIFFLLIFIR